MEKVVKRKPGVLIGLSTDKAYGSRPVQFFDGDKLVLEVELNQPFHHKGSYPGYEFDEPIFFKNGIKMVHDYDIDVDPFFS